MHRIAHRTSLIMAVTIAAFMAAGFIFVSSAQARGGGGGGGFGGGSRGGGFGGGGGDFSRPSGDFSGGYRPVQTPRTNVNTGTINRGNTINVAGSDYGWGGDGAWGAAALGAAAGAAIAGSDVPDGTVVYSLPPSCATEYVNGVPYQNCGGTYYQPTYQGSTLGYQVVSP